MTTTHSLATMIRAAATTLDAAGDRVANAQPFTDEAREASAAWDVAANRARHLSRIGRLCRRACGLARAGDSVVLVAPVGTSPDEVAGGLADEGAGSERVEVLCPSAEEWPAAYAAARQRAGVEVVS